MARVFTKEILLNPGDIQNMNNMLNQRANAESEQRKQFWNSLSNVFTSMNEGAAAFGKAYLEQKAADDRYNDIMINAADQDYADDPMFEAAAKESAKTGSSAPLNSFISQWNAAKKTAADEARNRLLEQTAYKENYGQSKADRDYAAQQLATLEKQNAENKAKYNTDLQNYATDKLRYEKAISDNERSMQKYGRLVDPNYILEEYKKQTIETPLPEVTTTETEVEDVSTVEPVVSDDTYESLNAAVDQLVNKGKGNYTDADIAEIENRLAKMTTDKGNEQYTALDNKIIEAKKNTTEAIAERKYQAALKKYNLDIEYNKLVAAWNSNKNEANADALENFTNKHNGYKMPAGANAYLTPVKPVKPMRK